MKQTRSPKKPNVYFTQETEDAIVQYNSTEDDIQRNIIYTKKIHPAFNKLAEIMIHRFKFYNFDIPVEDVKHEVVTFLHEKMHKFNAEHFQAFRSANYPVLAEAGVHIKYNQAAIKKRTTKKLKVHTNLDPNLAILKLFPGITQNVVEAILNAKGLRAMIIETFGSGNATTQKWFIEAIKRAIEKGIVVLNVTQCNAGKVEQGKYATSAALKKIGVIGGFDITSEAAVAKLMFVLGATSDKKEIEKMLKSDLRGEMTV